jgi:hypothetical protein
VYRSAKREGEGSTKSKRFRAVQVGPGLLDTMRDLRARSAEAHAADLTRAALFTMPVRVRKAERGRWGSREHFAAIDRNTVSRDWHKQALGKADLRDMPLHALRHTAAASWLLRASSDLRPAPARPRLDNHHRVVLWAPRGELSQERSGCDRGCDPRRRPPAGKLSRGSLRGCCAAQRLGGRVARQPAGTRSLEPRHQIVLDEAQRAVRPA